LRRYTKAGRRALFYELDVTCEWEAKHKASGNSLKAGGYLGTTTRLTLNRLRVCKSIHPECMS